MTIFFTSDTHYFHNNVISFCKRPFATVEEMNQAMLDNWNRVVASEDEVWFLGDFSFGKDDVTADVLRQLHGTKHLIVGNHDRKGRAERLFNKQWQEFFVDRHDYLRLKINENKFVLCHFPFASWERGYINLHGHVHSPKGYLNKYLQYDVGVDANDFTPVSSEAVVLRAQSGYLPPMPLGMSTVTSR